MPAASGRASRNQPHQNLQARHWLAETLLAALLVGGSNERMEVALAFPDIPRYRELIGKIEYAIEGLRLRVFLADESGYMKELARGVPSEN